jgi:hypothetical protein
MAYETKVLLIGLGKLIKAKAQGNENVELYKDLYNDISDMANAEGVMLEPFDKEKEV